MEHGYSPNSSIPCSCRLCKSSPIRVVSDRKNNQEPNERKHRELERPPDSHGTCGGLGGASRNGGALWERALSAAVAGRVLDAAAREKLVKQAAGKNGQRRAHAASVPIETRSAPVSAVDPGERGRTLESHDASHRAGA